jgi:hypothetical protein
LLYFPPSLLPLQAPLLYEGPSQFPFPTCQCHKATLVDSTSSFSSLPLPHIMDACHILGNELCSGDTRMQ